MQDFIIFTEGYKCGKILKVALDSFHKHHDLKVFVFGTKEDFKLLTPNDNNILIDCDEINYLRQNYEYGHAGTAFIFGKVFSGNLRDLVRYMNQDPGALVESKRIIHFDSDVFFKKESISLIEDKFKEGYDIIGSRRCYLNNPTRVPVDPSIPDATSTYFFGVNIEKLPHFDFNLFMRMCQGVENPLGHMVFDFFDPVTFVLLRNGASIHFLKQEIIGGQDSNGSKVSGFRTNMHLDMGENLAHFGGVGSGYAYHIDKQQQNESYGSWALGRWALFANLFYGEDLPCGGPVYGPDGRWVNGGYDQELLDLIKKDLYDAV